ncbi:FAD:protein FMN transferase [Limosilactobacillus fermentum]|uniref:FAD:protein FMN transferase n=1 Tax=Limosilactobacillus fermentum TaxID=1613 RepID=UPI002F261BD5
MKTIIKANVVEAMTVPFTISVAATDEKLIADYLGSVTPLIEANLKRVDARFSTFKADSLVGRFQRGEDSLLALDREFQQVYGAVSVAKDQTEGLFNPYYGGKYDPTGYVKGWSIQTAFEKHLAPFLEDPRVVGVCLNGGGEALAVNDAGALLGGPNREDGVQVAQIRSVGRSAPFRLGRRPGRN